MTIVRLKFHAREIGNSCTNLSSSRIRAQWRCDGTGYKAPRNRRRALEESLSRLIEIRSIALFQCSARVSARRWPTDFWVNVEDTLGS